MRLARPLALFAVVALVGACTSFDPSWTFAPSPSATPIASGAAPSGGAGGSAAPPSAAASGEPGGSAAPPSGGGPTVDLTAVNIAFDPTTLDAPANTAFTLAFQNNDNGVPHDVAIKDGGGAVVFGGEIFNGVDKRDYAVPALAAGTYTFVCTVHPNMTGTLTVQ